MDFRVKGVVHGHRGLRLDVFEELGAVQQRRSALLVTHFCQIICLSTEPYLVLSGISNITNFEYTQIFRAMPRRNLSETIAQAVSNNCSESNHKASPVFEEQETKFECSQSHGQIEAADQAICRLFAKNKINAHNAFDIPLIDISDLQSIKENSETAWNRIANTLQNSSRIYGFRVDSITDNVSRITNTMMRTNQAQQPKQTHVEDENYGQSISKLYPNNTETNYKKHLQIGHQYRLNAMVQIRDSSKQLSMRRKFDQNKLDNMLLSCLVVGPQLQLSFCEGEQRTVGHSSDDAVELETLGSMPLLEEFRPSTAQANSNNAAGQSMGITSQISALKKILFDDQHRSCDMDIERDDQSDIDAIANNFEWRDNRALMNDYENVEIIECHALGSDSGQLYADSAQKLPNDNIYSKGRKKGRKSVKKQGKGNKKPKSKKPKKQQYCIDFSLSTDDKLCKKSVMAVTIAELLPKRRAQSSQYSDKNLIQPPYIGSPIHFQHSYLQQSEELLSNSVQQPQRMENGACISSMSQVYDISQFSQSCDLRVPNIKATKRKLANILAEEDEQFTFDRVYHRYCADSLCNSQAICFVSILHLCNQMSLGLQSMGEYDFRIKEQ